MLRVQRLQAHVTLDDDDTAALARAEAEAAAGDESWRRWVAEYRRGEALIVRLAVRLELDDGEHAVAETANRGVFIEKDPEPPKVEQQVAELVSKDFSALGRELVARGHSTDGVDLHTMYVHVELSADVRRTLADAGSAHRSTRGGAPQSEEELSEHEDPNGR